MKKSLILILFAALFLAVNSRHTKSSNYLSAIEVVSSNEEIPIAPREYEDLSKGVIHDDLDLTEDIDDQRIILHPISGTTTQFRIEERFETSVSIQAEGPHLDLTNWKHYYSPWKELRRVGDNSFLTLRIPTSQFTRFPRVTAAEIKKEVLRVGGKRWAALVRNIKGPNDYPSMVSINKVSFRVLVKEGERWRPVVFLHFDMPMGC